jgi:hypothetical protein
MIPIAAATSKATSKAVIAVAPPTLLVAWTKISMNGKPVGLFNALVMSPRQKSIAI